MVDGYVGYDSFGYSYIVGYDIFLLYSFIVGLVGGYIKIYVDMFDYCDGDMLNVDSY